MESGSTQIVLQSLQPYPIGTFVTLWLLSRPMSVSLIDPFLLENSSLNEKSKDLHCRSVCALPGEALLKVLQYFLQKLRCMRNRLSSDWIQIHLSSNYSNVCVCSLHLTGVYFLFPVSLYFVLFSLPTPNVTVPFQSFPSGIAVNCCYHLPPEIKLPHILTAWHRWWLFKTLWLLSLAWLAVLWRRPP